MNEDEFFRILGIDLKESDETTSFFYDEYFYDDSSSGDVASESYDP